MPLYSGACLECMRIQTWRVHTRSLEAASMPRCTLCGQRLTRPGGRAYELVSFEVDAAARADNIRHNLAPRWLPPRSPQTEQHEQQVATNMGRWAREMAHDARRLFPHLRFEFDTDPRGRPLN